MNSFLSITLITVLSVGQMHLSFASDNEDCKKALKKEDVQKSTTFQANQINIISRIKEITHNIFTSIPDFSGEFKRPLLLFNSLEAKNHKPNLLPPRSNKNSNSSSRSEQNKIDFYLSFDKPGISYFRFHFFQTIDLFNGISEKQNVLSKNELIIPPGIASATMLIENRLVGAATTLPIPQGYRPLPSNQQKNKLKIWKEATGEYFFRSFQVSEDIEILMTENTEEQISTKELEAYTSIFNLPEINAWPENFRNELIKLLTFIKENPDYSSVELGYLVATWIEKLFIYTKEGNDATNVFEAVESGKIQCSWASTLWTGILRGYLKIPARSADGFMGSGHINFSQHSFIESNPEAAHAWGEVYDFKNQKWVTIDPTPSAPPTVDKNNDDKKDFFDLPSRSRDSKNPFENTNLNDLFYGLGAASAPLLLPSYALSWLLDLMKLDGGGPGDTDLGNEENNYQKQRELADKNETVKIYLDGFWINTLRSYFKHSPLEFTQRIINFISQFDDAIAAGHEFSKMPAFKNMFARLKTVAQKLILLGHLEEKETLHFPIRNDFSSLKYTTKSILGIQQLVLSELERISTLTVAENNLKIFIYEILSKEKPIENRSLVTKEAISYLLPGPLSQKNLKETLKKFSSFEEFIESEDSNPFFQEIAVTQIIRTYSPGTPKDSADETPRYDNYSVISDHDADTVLADSLSDWPRFVKNGLTPEMSMFKFYSDSMDMRVYRDLSENKNIIYRNPKEVLVTSFKNKNPYENYIQKIRLDLALEESYSLSSKHFPHIFITQNYSKNYIAENFSELENVLSKIDDSKNINYEETHALATSLFRSSTEEVSRIRYLILSDLGIEPFSHRNETTEYTREIFASKLRNKVFEIRKNKNKDGEYSQSLIISEEVATIIGLYGKENASSLKNQFLEMIPLLAPSQDISLSESEIKTWNLLSKKLSTERPLLFTKPLSHQWLNYFKNSKIMEKYQHEKDHHMHSFIKEQRDYYKSYTDWAFEKLKPVSEMHTFFKHENKDETEPRFLDADGMTYILEKLSYRFMNVSLADTAWIIDSLSVFNGFQYRIDQAYETFLASKKARK